METFLTFVHVLICVLLVLVILIQPGKSGMGGALGGSSAGTFGAKSPTTILSKFTVAMAVGFMVSSLTLAWLSVREHTVRIDLGLGQDTHYPAAGLALPGDLSIPDQAGEIDGAETGVAAPDQVEQAEPGQQDASDGAGPEDGEIPSGEE
jgi:preprotein translocase subunit SecG